MTVTIPWWGPLVAISVFAFGVANWWPDDSTGYGAAAGGFIRLLILVIGLSILWIGALIWRLNL